MTKQTAPSSCKSRQIVNLSSYDCRLTPNDRETTYVVFTREKMRNCEEYEHYREKSRTANASHPLKPLALYGKLEVLEGPPIEGAVILEFPTIEAAKNYYHNAAYQDVVKHRFLGADYRAFIVEGV